MSCGSNSPLRSRGICSSTSDPSVLIVLREEPPAGVAAAAAGRRVLLVAEQVGQFPLEGLLDKSFAEVFEQVFNLAGGFPFRQELFQELGVK